MVTTFFSFESLQFPAVSRSSRAAQGRPQAPYMSVCTAAAAEARARASMVSVDGRSPYARSPEMGWASPRELFTVGVTTRRHSGVLVWNNETPYLYLHFGILRKTVRAWTVELATFDCKSLGSPPLSLVSFFVTIRFRGSTTGIARAVVDAFIEVPGRERESHASSERVARARSTRRAT
jgi:hypothetical protein